MEKPYLIVVTGRPGAGKTTFALELGKCMFMPVISRDQIKEGYVHTFGKRHTELPKEANGIATEVFFDTVQGLLERHVSLIIEAAFQHTLWSTGLAPLLPIARTHLIICNVADDVAMDRFLERGLSNPLREHFHGDKGVDMARRGLHVQAGAYDPPRLDVPTHIVDTSDSYDPSIATLVERILGSIS